jgi:hypothetical protein
MSKPKFHACLDHPTEILEGVQVVLWWMFALEELHFFMLDQVEQVGKDILFIFEVLVETTFCNAAVFHNPVRGGILQTVFSKFLNGSIHDRFALFFGEVEKSLLRHKM